MRRYKVSRAADITRDLELIGEHLVRAYQEFGEDLDDAMERAGARIDEALAYMRTFATYPYRGTEHPRVRPGIRTVTNKNFVIYFEIDEASSEVRILATFFGAADHGRQIADRLRIRGQGSCPLAWCSNADPRQGPRLIRLSDVTARRSDRC